MFHRHRGAQNELTRTNYAGETAVILNGYRVLHELGRGGMATVYRVEQESGFREFAIKVLHESRAWDSECVLRFRQEAQALSLLSHPHIVTVYDYGRSDDGDIYFVMELLQGEMLSELLMRDGALPFPRTLTILRQVAQALEVVHAHGIVHRDLKPDNVHIQRHPSGSLIVRAVREGDVEPKGESDFVKLIDFGIAQFPEIADDSEHSRGTPLYMSPEQIRAENMDARTDIYGMGLLMYEMLTGQPPFSASTIDEITDLHLKVLPPRPQLVRPDLHLPEAAEQMVLKALSKDPAQRQQNARAFLEELAELERCAPNRSLPRAVR